MMTQQLHGEKQKLEKPTNERKMLNLFIDKILWKKIRQMALDHEVTMTKIVNDALEDYVKNRGR